MNFSHYKGLVKNEKVHRFIFAQGNRPAAELLDGQVEYLSETFLFKEDMKSIMDEVSGIVDPASPTNFFMDGLKYSYKTLTLADTSQIVIYPKENLEFDWADLQIPGYVNDWAEAQSGILIFYGSDFDFVEKVRLSFAKRRTEVVKGSSIVFSSKRLENMVSNEGHFLTCSTDEAGFLQADSNMSFDSYSFVGDPSSLDSGKLLRVADRTALIVMNSYWSDLEKVWSEISRNIEDDNVRNLFFKNIIGFVGVKKVESQDAQGRVVFEAVPMMQPADFEGLSFSEQVTNLKGALKQQGVSFNQSIHSLVIKRKISLDNAYKVSADPEELNRFLSESGV